MPITPSKLISLSSSPLKQDELVLTSFHGVEEVSKLFKQSLIAVAAPKLTGNASLPLSPEILSRQPKIHDTHDLWPGYLAHLGVSDQSPRGLRLSQTSLAVDAAIAGQGVALVSRFLVANDLAAGRLIEVGNAWETGGGDFYVLMQRTAKINKPVTDVMAWLKARSTEIT